jgi:hypothetical protein
MGVSSLCAGCSNNDCDEVASLMRQCCAKGPAELREECEAEAKRLEDDGNEAACKDAKGKLAGCN